MKLVITDKALPYVKLTRQFVTLPVADFAQISALVLTMQEKAIWLEQVNATKFAIPVFLLVDDGAIVAPDILANITGVFYAKPQLAVAQGEQLEQAASDYEQQQLPVFFAALKDYVNAQNVQFSCPGHQGGDFFRRHPAGVQFSEFFGDNIFRADLCNADVKLGDLLIHEGAPLTAQKHAAKVFNADKTYFVLNGTSAANKVVANAILTKGDLVLFDRNNHKSNHHGALLQAGATPVYLPATRNPFGLIGGIDSNCFSEQYIRQQIAKVAPDRANLARPFRLAIIQLGTYDGTIYNARQVVDKIGHLCDYILFDSAWVGYEQFISMMKDCSPLLLQLTADDPGILVTQSVHKQQAGFSQASQIHKKDHHIKGQTRYCNHKRMNNAFMLYASTSPFYPLFASLDVNAKIHAGESGKVLWQDCVKLGIQARKQILASCQMLKPFIPLQINGTAWQDYATETIAQDLQFFKFDPQQNWHGFAGYATNQYFVDPCKLLLTTPGIDMVTGQYSQFGIPASILANFLRENGLIPEKSDLNSILFLLTPAVSQDKIDKLVDLLVKFEQHIQQDSPLEQVLPSIYQAHQQRYQGYSIVQLCQQMHDLARANNLKLLQQQMFSGEHLPKVAMPPIDAHIEYMRGNAKLVPIEQAEGKIALEGALPYPPGVLCIIPGEIWSGAVLKYFIALQQSINLFPGFAPELQGVYLQSDVNGKTRIFTHVYTN